MITELVTFQLPSGMNRPQVVEAFRKSVPGWSANPDLIRKNYIYDAARGVAGGIYLWHTIEEAKRWHGEAFRRRIVEMFGSEPVSTYYETPIVIDNAVKKVIDESVAA